MPLSDPSDGGGAPPDFRTDRFLFFTPPWRPERRKPNFCTGPPNSSAPRINLERRTTYDSRATSTDARRILLPDARTGRRLRMTAITVSATVWVPRQLLPDWTACSRRRRDGRTERTSQCSPGRRSTIPTTRRILRRFSIPPRVRYPWSQDKRMRQITLHGGVSGREVDGRRTAVEDPRCPSARETRAISSTP